MNLRLIPRHIIKMTRIHPLTGRNARMDFFGSGKFIIRSEYFFTIRLNIQTKAASTRTVPIASHMICSDGHIAR